MKLSIIIIAIFFSINMLAQKPAADTLNIKEPKIHSPKKATLMSAFFPGLGQIYNKKYWKAPIVYSAIGASLYFVVANNKSFKRYKTAYGYRVDNNPATIDEFVGKMSDDNLKANMEYFQRNRDLSVIITGLFYVLNIVDATVDAHFFNFPKNDNLSFKLQPRIFYTNNNQLSKGLTLVINL